MVDARKWRRPHALAASIVAIRRLQLLTSPESIPDKDECDKAENYAPDHNERNENLLRGLTPDFLLRFKHRQKCIKKEWQPKKDFSSDPPVLCAHVSRLVCPMFSNSMSVVEISFWAVSFPQNFNEQYGRLALTAL